MRVKPVCTAILAAVMSLFIVFSCSKKEKKAQSAPPDTTKKISYISEEVSFSLSFDEGDAKRTIKLERGQKQVKIYLFVNWPERMQICAVEYRVALPQGVTIENDKFYEKRVALIGNFEKGISETFPCVAGPKLLLHTLTLNVPPGLKNAEIALLPDKDGDFVGIATCDPGNPSIQASSYKAVINPTE